MGLVLNNKKQKVVLNSKSIIGLVGDYDELIHKLDRKNVSIIKEDSLFNTGNVKSELLLHSPISDEKLALLLKELSLDDKFLNKKISMLSDGERRLLEYLLMLIDNKKIIIIENVFFSLDYSYKKIIINLLKRMAYKNKKTILISGDINDIYALCKEILFVKNKNYYYDNTIDAFKNREVLKEFNVSEPNIIQFIHLSEEKGIKLNYVTDIRDLIKDVYKNVQD